MPANHEPLRGTPGVDHAGPEPGRTRWRRLLREPLVQFLLGGFLVFAIFGWRDEEADASERTIRIGTEQIEALEVRFTQAWQRPPTEAERAALIADEVKSEIYAREARRAGLDRDDPVVRRRLRSRMEYIARSAAESDAPDKAELAAFYRNNADVYGGEREISFDQIFLGQRATAADTKEALTELRAGRRWNDIGTTIALPPSLQGVDRAEVAAKFGSEFAESLFALGESDWTGPLASGFGTHLVRVSQIGKGSLPALEEIRDRVEQDWRTEQAARGEQRAYEQLLQRYSVEVEGR